MITVFPTLDKDVIKSFVTHPVLFKMAGFTIKPEEYEVPESSLWVLITQDNIDIGVFELRKVTNITYDIHTYILPEYHNTATTLEATKTGLEFLKEHTTIKTIIITTPQECLYIVKHVLKVGFKPCGIIDDGVIYNNKRQNLVILQYEVQ